MKKLIGLVSMGIILVGCGRNYGQSDLEKLDKSDLILSVEEEFKESGVNLSLDDIILSNEEDDENISQVIKEAIDYKPEYGQVNYFYNQVDLNDDGKHEILVYLTGGYVSGSGGSTLLLLDSSGDLRQSFSLINNPLIVSDEKTNGYRNIIVPVYGGGASFHFAELKYDGKVYPSNPSMVDKLEEGRVIRGTSVLSDPLKGENKGILLK